MELKTIVLPVSHELLHGNRDLPANFMGWLGVMDTAVPQSGLEHKAKDKDTKKEDIGEVSHFVRSELWKLAGLDPRKAPRIVSETEWEVPSADGDVLRSNEGHRSYTDFQQTAQWLAGTEIPSTILTALFAGAIAKGSTICIHNITPYDGALERALLNMRDNYNIYCISAAPNATVCSFVTSSVKNALLQVLLMLSPLACVYIYI